MSSPVIGDLRITEIARRDVRDVFEPIERAGKLVVGAPHLCGHPRDAALGCGARVPVDEPG